MALRGAGEDEAVGGQKLRDDRQAAAVAGVGGQRAQRLQQLGGQAGAREGLQALLDTALAASAATS